MRDLEVQSVAVAPGTPCDFTQRRMVRAHRRRGAELIEFMLTLLPLLTLTFVLLDVAWGIFARATLEFAVRAGVRTGITITKTQTTTFGSDLTSLVRDIVQRNSLGLLRGPTGLHTIMVRFYKPPASGSTAPATPVSDQADGNSPLNIMQVSIEGFTLPALLPRFYWFGWRGGGNTWSQRPDLAGTNVAAISADLIEPSRDVPPKGPAPAWNSPLP